MKKQFNVRLPRPLGVAFESECKAAGVSVSEGVQGLIYAFVTMCDEERIKKMFPKGPCLQKESGCSLCGREDPTLQQGGVERSLGKAGLSIVGSSARGAMTSSQ